MDKTHLYQASIEWTGNKGVGTKDYRAYERSHTINIEGKPSILGSSDPAFRGDKTRYSPEDLFITTLSSCHMLWFLHFCSEAGVVVVEYLDNVTGTMVETPEGNGYFTGVTLNPVVTVAEESMVETANRLHEKANEFCFIANSVNFPVRHNPVAKALEG